jgi:hypothetical protein
MRPLTKAFLVFVIYLGTSFAWLLLGGSMKLRTETQHDRLEGRVEELWGREHVQRAPTLSLVPNDTETLPLPGAPNLVAVESSSASVDVQLDLDQRLKGLTWYSLYDVAFEGHWTYVYDASPVGKLAIAFDLPDPSGVYDGFRFAVNGQPVDSNPVAGRFGTLIEVYEGDVVTIDLAYKSRGLDAWSYAPSTSGNVKGLDLHMTTNFGAVDFPEATLSPSSIAATDDGKKLSWSFENILTTQRIGVTMPKRLQPGQLAAELSFTAPISLLFFFLVVAVLAKLEKLDIHPINYLFVSASFFAFHLLFAYLVDHVALWVAFALASATSVAMVTSYFRLVVSARFGFVKAGVAQLVYLVGFGMAHFADGFTGLTITVLSIGTVFLLMLLTGRIKWSEVLRTPEPPPPAQEPPYRQPAPFQAPFPNPSVR